MSDSRRPGDFWIDLDDLDRRIEAIERMLPSLVSETWRTVGSVGEVVVFQNSWTHYDQTGWGPVRFKKAAGGIVRLRGLIASGSALRSVMFQLPQGYRPFGVVGTDLAGSGEIFPVASASGAYAELRVLGNGNVYLETGGSTSWTSLDGVSFSAEQ